MFGDETKMCQETFTTPNEINTHVRFEHKITVTLYFKTITNYINYNNIFIYFLAKKRVHDNPQ